MVKNHWGRVTHICVSKITIIASDNGLSPGRRQAIIWINAGILLIGSLGTKFSEIYIENLTFSFRKIRLKVSSAKWRPFCLGLNVLSNSQPRWRCNDICDTSKERPPSPQRLWNITHRNAPYQPPASLRSDSLASLSRARAGEMEAITCPGIYILTV